MTSAPSLCSLLARAPRLSSGIPRTKPQPLLPIMATTTTPRFLSAASANALISELRPTTLSPAALQHVNALLDEVLVALVTGAGSVNPIHLRLQGVPAVFSSERGAAESTGLRALGRSAVGEAEVELRSWYESRPMSKGPQGFPPDGKGRGLLGDRERANVTFPLEQAIQLLRFKVVSFCTLAPQTSPAKSYEQQVTTAWTTVGGDLSEETVAPAGLWVTAIIEHLCEHILSQLSRVVARDSSITVAGVQEVYTALCEDESTYGLFKKTKVKEAVEQAIRSGERSKRGTPQRPSTIASSPTMSNSPHGSKTSFDQPEVSPSRNTKPPPSSYDAPRSSSSFDSFRPGKGSMASLSNSLRGKKNHERSGSVISNTTRQILTAFHDDETRNSLDKTKAAVEEEDDFDALIRSGETMKVSLTPSRLKTFESMSPRQSQTPEMRTTPRAPQSAAVPAPAAVEDPEDLPPLLPHTVQPSATDLRLRPAGGGGNMPLPNMRPQIARMRSSGSVAKLVPRGPTIEEKDEDDDGAAGRPKDGQSLMELLKSEIADERSKRRSSGKRPPNAERTVPAVIVGTPPPPKENEATFLQVPGAAPSRQAQSAKQSSMQPPTQAPPPAARQAASTIQPQTAAPTLATPVSPPLDGTTQPLRISKVPSPAAKPSPLPSPPTSPKPTANRDFARELDDDDAADLLGNYRPPSSKPKSATRELADFLNSTPPPEPTARSIEQAEVEPEAPRKGSLGRLMAMMTGGKKKDEAPTSPTRSGSAASPTQTKTARFDDQPTVRTQASSQSLGSRPAPSAYKADAPPMPKGVLRKQPNRDASPGPASALTSAPVPTSTPASAPTSASPDRARAGSVGGPNFVQSSTAPTIATRPPLPAPVPPFVQAQPSEASGTAAGLANVLKTRGHGGYEHIGSSSRLSAFSEEQVSPRSPAVPSMLMAMAPDVDEPSTDATTPVAPPSQVDGQVNGSGSRQESTVEPDDRSYMTADEGGAEDALDSVPEAASIRSGHTQSPPAPIAPASPPPATHAIRSASVPNGGVPHIPLADLVPLRSLLEHATSARECRLLLNAILSQWGVPTAERGARLSPEDRVTAWLLAGHDGPADRNSIGSQATEVLVTPTQHGRDLERVHGVNGHPHAHAPEPPAAAAATQQEARPPVEQANKYIGLGALSQATPPTPSEVFSAASDDEEMERVDRIRSIGTAY
ncbi:hypothetical protein Q5752_001502 [Cryptotrichosporon argae]